MISNPRDIGAEVQVTANPDPDSAAGVVDGTGIDRTDFSSCVLKLSTGAATGGPSPQTADAKLQDSADNSNFADVTDGAVTQITADSGEEFVDIDLSQLEQFVRVRRTVVLTGGASPTWAVSTELVFGG